MNSSAIVLDRLEPRRTSGVVCLSRALMIDRPLRTPVVAGLCLVVALTVGARAARAQATADGGAAPSVNPSADGGMAADGGGGAHPAGDRDAPYSHARPCRPSNDPLFCCPRVGVPSIAIAANRYEPKEAIDPVI